MSEVLRVPGEFEDAINHAANYEPKAVTWLALHDLGRATTADLDKTMCDKAEIDTVYSAATKFFAESGFATFEMGESAYNSRLVRYYRPERSDHALPVLGTILPWGLEHDIALKTVLGVTRARRGACQRAPMNSIQILATIAAGKPVRRRIRKKYKKYS